MKFALSLVCLVAVLAVAFAKPDGKMTGAEIKKAIHKLFGDCKDEAGASEADLKAVRSMKIPESHEGLCMMECVYEKSKIMKNGKFNKDGAIFTLSWHRGDHNSSKTESATNLAEFCNTEIGEGNSDKCIIAKLITECIVKNAVKYDIQLNELTE